MDIEVFTRFQRDMEDLEAFNKFTTGEFFEHSAKSRSPVKKKRRKKLNPLTDLEDHQFRQKYRFTKDNMRRIIEMIDLDPDISGGRKNQVPVELQIMAAIRLWGRTEHPDITASVHGVSSRTMGKISKRIGSCLAAKASRYIRMPATLAEKERVAAAFRELGHMPQVIGAVGHYNVRFKRAHTEAELHTDNNGLDLHVQIVSDASLKIRDLDCKDSPDGELNYESEMFTHSRIKERFEQHEFRGRILLGNSNLSCTQYLFTPINCASTIKEEAFNRSHEFTYAAVTNCINLLRKRFGIIQSELNVSLSTAKQIIIALALLHNMAIEWNDPSLENGMVCLQNHCEQSAKGTAPSPPLLTKNSETNARLEFVKNHF